MSRWLRAAATLVALAGGVLHAGQASQPPPQQTPTFRTGVEYVEVDAIVTDAGGQFIRDLQKDDFEVLEDGRTQAIADFRLIDIPIERFDKPLYAAEPIEPDAKSNDRPFDGRVYVMIVDDLHTAFSTTARTRSAARSFIQQRMGANDIMAVLHTAGGDDASQEFTSSKRLLLAAVDRTLGRKLQSSTITRAQRSFRAGIADDPDDIERARNAETSLRLIKDVADWFSTVRGRRKAILFFSEGIDYDITQVVSGGPDSRQAVPPAAWAAGVLDATREAVDAAMRSNVSIFGIDPRGLAIDDVDASIQSFPSNPMDGVSASSLRSELRLSQDSLRTVADETGGFAVVGNNDLAAAYDRIVAENSSYYVLAYYPPSDKRDGKFHRIDVRVKRAGLSVRARRGYLSPRGRPPAPPAASDRGPSLALRETLNSPLPVSGLTMTVSFAPFKGVAPNASVFLAAEFRGENLNLAANNSLEFSYLAVDPRGRVRGGNNDRVRWNLKPETQAQIARSGFRTLNRIEVPPGRYQVRVASHDEAGGSVGSVTYDLEVPDFHKQAFSMSGVVMTSLSTGGMTTLRPDEQLQDVLPAAPVATRTFPQNDEVALFAEVYDNAGNVPHRVDIVTTVTDDVGKVWFKAEEERSSTEIGGARGGYGYVARVPLVDVPPGSYVLAVEARSRLGDGPRALRQVPIRVTAASAQASATPMRVLEQGTQTYVDLPRQLVARTQGEWDAVWKQHAPGRPQPTVDFEREMVVGVFLGSRTTAGYAVQIVGAEEQQDGLVVRYTEATPPPASVVAQVITSPYSLVALPKRGGNVRFEKTR
jgi:VWFA-related protein